MRQDQLDRLQAQRAKLADTVQQLLDTPEPERPTESKALRAWLRDLESAQQLLAELDGLIGGGERAKARKDRAEAKAARKTQPAEPASQDAPEALVLAQIQKSRSAVVRVSLQTWKGIRTIDIRTWALIQGNDELRPTTKGVQVDVKRLPALLEALKLAQQHV